MSTLKIKIEEVEQGQYKITYEDDIAVTHVVTGRPVPTMVKILREMGIKGKRGRPKHTAPSPLAS